MIELAQGTSLNQTYFSYAIIHGCSTENQGIHLLRRKNDSLSLGFFGMVALCMLSFIKLDDYAIVV